MKEKAFLPTYIEECVALDSFIVSDITDGDKDLIGKQCSTSQVIYF